MKTLKYSRQRESIKNCLMNRTDHPTADALYLSIRIGIQPTITIIVTIIIYKYKEMSRGFFLKTIVSVIIL